MRAAKKRPRVMHGDSQSAEYKIWGGILSRCNNPRHTPYPFYGGRGIRVCDRWLQYENFLADMGRRPSPKHSIDRIDNDGDYAPENCRWAVMSEQWRNTRRTRLVSFRGKTQCLKDWATELGINYSTLHTRITRYGWPVQRALTTKAKR